MILIRADLFESDADYILVTTNGYVRTDGCLVMGAGAALEAATRHPNLPKILGRIIASRAPYYGVIIPRRIRFGAFQVKKHWRERADHGLILHSADILGMIAKAMPEHKFAVNFPGIGNGRLDRNEVMPLISRLPDNVWVHER